MAIAQSRRNKGIHTIKEGIKQERDESKSQTNQTAYPCTKLQNFDKERKEKKKVEQSTLGITDAMSPKSVLGEARKILPRSETGSNAAERDRRWYPHRWEKLGIDESSIFDRGHLRRRRRRRRRRFWIQGREEASVFWRWRGIAGEKRGAAFPALNTSLAFTAPSR